MIEKIYITPQGNIHYFINVIDIERPTLIFLPGLSADHRLFDKQISYFKDKYNIITWDAPGHASSRPFILDFKLSDKANWLNDILDVEGIENTVIVGQSMGGYVGQMYMDLFPGVLSGFVSIDSAPLKRMYMCDTEIFLLKYTEPMYRLYPWKVLVRDGAKGCATSEYGISLMQSMILQYGKKEYAALVGHGYRMLAEAFESNRPYEVCCPAILICGEDDRAGYTKKYNKKWNEQSGIPVFWVKGAGHNSNTDNPDEINQIIFRFVESL